MRWSAYWTMVCLLLAVPLSLNVVGCAATSPYIASSLPTEPKPELRALLDRAVRLSWRDRQRAEGLLEEAFARAAEFPITRDREIGRMYALAVRSQLAEDREARLAAYREALGLARDLGGELLEAEVVKYIGLSMYRAKRLEAAAGELGEAARRFRTTGDSGQEGESLLWQASVLLTLGSYADAEDLYRQARSLLVAGGALAYAAACDAALGFIARADRARTPAFMTSYGWACEMVREDGGVFTYEGRSAAGGYAASGRERMLRLSLLSEAGVMKTLLDGSRRAGDIWEDRAPTRLLRTEATLVSEDADVTVPAGTFAGCRVVRMVTRETDEAMEADAGTRRANRARCGVREVSYAPGVGIVRLRVAFANGLSTALVLKEYRVQEPTASFLPLNPGNRWVYVWEGIDGENYLTEQVLDARFRDDAGVHYLANYIYAHRRGRPPGLRRDARVVQAGHTPQDLPLDAHAYVVAHERISRWTDHARFTTRSGEAVRVLVGENGAGIRALQVTPTVGQAGVTFEFVAMEDGGRISAVWYLDRAVWGKAIRTATRSVLRPEYMIKLRVKPDLTPQGDVTVVFDALFAVPPTRAESRRWRMHAQRR